MKRYAIKTVGGLYAGIKVDTDGFIFYTDNESAGRKTKIFENLKTAKNVLYTLNHLIPDAEKFIFEIIEIKK